MKNNKTKQYIKEFGLIFYFKIQCLRILRKILPMNWVYELYFNLKKKKLLKEIKDDIVSLTVTDNSKVDANTPIWILWWQGMDNAPQLVQGFVENVKKNAGTHPVIVISEDNFHNYINLPQYIMDKVSSKNITITHLSDIARMYLINEYGGIWLDPTILLIDNSVIKNMEGYMLYSIKHKPVEHFVNNGKWTAYCLAGGKGCVVAKSMYDLFCKYWEKHDVMIDYFLIDYMLQLMYENNKNVKQLIDNIPFNNKDVEKLNQISNNIYDQSIYDELLQNTKIFKLSWKYKYKEYVDGKPTFYKIIKDNYLLSNKN